MELLRNYFEGTGTGSQPTFFFKKLFFAIAFAKSCHLHPIPRGGCQFPLPSHSQNHAEIRRKIRLLKTTPTDLHEHVTTLIHSLNERLPKNHSSIIYYAYMCTFIHTHSHQVGCCYCSDTTGRGSHLNLDSTLVLCRSTLEMTANDGNPPFLHPRHMLDQVNLHCCCWFEWLRTTNTLLCPIVSRHSILAKIERL